MADRSTRQKRYSEEFKLQAARLIVEGGVTYHQASEQLGVLRQGVPVRYAWIVSVRLGRAAPVGISTRGFNVPSQGTHNQSDALILKCLSGNE